jgi:hypothetical protein
MHIEPAFARRLPIWREYSHFEGLPQDNREVLPFTGTAASPNGGRGTDLVISPMLSLLPHSRPMLMMGHQRKFQNARRMSALFPKADSDRKLGARVTVIWN